ncbi:MAG TPA: hypothetical protein VMR81_01110 [Patescibacteria group bacterium]|jgi:hypothetical protein|nr:hypothetical protein [Patescibacteria group bacterium]
MFDHIFGLILLGLGIKSPVTSPNVMGDSTTQSAVTTDRYHMATGSGDHVSPPPFDYHGTATGRGYAGTTSGTLPPHLTDTHRTSTTSGKPYVLRLGVLRKDLTMDIETIRKEASASMKPRLFAFQQKLTTITDHTKQYTVSDIQNRLTALNIKRTDTMTGQLNKMSDLLGRIASMGADLQSNGKDTSGLDAAITQAQSAVKTAQDAVVAQAGKQYVITITSQTNLKSDVSAVEQTLASDFKTVYGLLTSARTSMSNAIRVLATLRGEKVPSTITK